MIDHKVSYTFQDVEEGKVKYKDYIISEVLDVLAVKKEIDRSLIAERLLYSYGGTLEIAILDCIRNMGL